MFSKKSASVTGCGHIVRRWLFFHRQGLHEYVRAGGATAIGQGNGCGLLAPSRITRLRQMITASRRATTRTRELTDGFSEWRSPLGNIVAPPRNNPQFAIAEQMAAVYTEGDMGIRPGEVVLDCGANIGDFVLVCLRAGAGKIIAIDPSLLNVAAMQHSFPAEITSGRVVIVAKGVWHEESTMKMTVFPENSLLDTFVMPGRDNPNQLKTREIELPVTTIDKLVAELLLDRVDFIKMDIEGAERNAIRGAAKTIARFRPRMSIATENLADDYLVVPREIAKISRYSVRCGLCAQTGTLAYRPDILFFKP